MQLTFDTDGTTLTAKLSGELDHHVSAKLRETIDLKLTSGVYNTLILDFSELTFMDSSGIAVVMGRAKVLSSIGGRVIVKVSDEKIKRILTLSGLENYVSFI